MPALKAIQSPTNEDVLMSLAMKAEPKNITEALNKAQASPSDIARVVGDVMNNSQKDGTKLAAAKLASELHGLDKGKGESNINIVINEGNVNLNQLFNPIR